ncbi:Flagellar hook-associated protein 2 (FliD, filament cap protein) [uncultured Alphaproteobacteria bacterium]|uniref:Flagellar hook-associated protein 2 n=1 Tax=uncultured Alphaproteobacteria bacterium TaxID=91750 RepID=A0A212JVK7_9PROT|nr:Flagellar hook-associated protein 2 (FliD, filament cap protein) [uncultured Alphaproteobacteria bacterium]
MSTTVTSASGTTYISGSGTSGFDSSALIEAAVEAKMAAAYRIDDQVDVLETEVTGWETMLSDLTAVSDAAEALSGAADDSVWDDRAAYLSSSTVSDPDDVLAVTVDEDAALGIYTVEVKQLATSHKVASSEQSSKTEALGLSGSFTLTEGDGTAATISVTEDMTLADIADAINDASSTTGVTATLMKTSDSGYTLVLASADTGQSITATDTDGSVLESLGILASDDGFANELQAAQDAIITIDGVTITSSSNDIEDVMPGVSLSLYDDSAGGTITLEVGQDLDGVADAITALVDAYNTYREFAILNQTTDENGAVDDAVLFGESLLRSANSALYDILGMSVEVDGTTYTLADLGISYDDDNYLEVDDDTLEEMLIQHADVVQAFFEQSVVSSSSDLYVAETPGGLAAGTYAVEITLNADGTLASASIDGVALEVSNKTITGADGTDYEGLRLVYTGSTDATVTLTVEAGLADSMAAGLADYVDDDGRIQDRIDSLNDTIDDKQERRDLIAERAEDYEAYLTEYYARIEVAMEAAETNLALVKALFNTDDDD